MRSSVFCIPLFLAFTAVGCTASGDDDPNEESVTSEAQTVQASGPAHVNVAKTQLHELQANGLPGKFLGWLFKNDNFRVDHAGAYWCRGHAYGGLHQDGIVPCENLSAGYK